MTTEEKAKAYDEALERARDSFTYPDYPGFIRADVVFPELKESDDESIRKAIIEFFELQDDNTTYSFVPKKDILAWLEKQGKKPQGKTALEAIKEEKVDNANKIEPKFHEGDFIKHNKANIIYKVISVNSGSYYVENIETSGRIELFNAEQNFHLWTIQDAKYGDVLVSKDDKPFIYNGNHDSFNIGSYCGISVEDKFKVSTEKCYWTGKVNIYPATKEQRDLLFQKMHEAGYEWDSEKKELKEIKIKRMTDTQYLDKALDFIVEREHDGDYICCALHDIPKEYKICSEDCQNLCRNCVLRFLKNYKKGGEE